MLNEVPVPILSGKSRYVGYAVKKMFIINLLLAALAAFSCNSTEPEGGLKISLEDVSCTEAWIKVSGETGTDMEKN